MLNTATQQHPQNTVAMWIALAVLVAFIVVFGWAAVQIFQDYKYPFAETFVIVASVLGGLVGGIVAVAFNQRLPEPEQHKGLRAIVTGFFPGAYAQWKQWVALVYILAYAIVAIGAILIWIAYPDVTQFIKIFAATALGLLLAIARGLLTP